ncbi:MAG: BrnT family toxin [Terriglobales bacterium]
MAELSFEWDEEKNAANIKNHGIDFLDAALIFASPTLEAIDDRADCGEVRTIAFGLSGETVLQVVYTRRGENVIRIISARKANRYDREKYYREIFAYRDQEKNRPRRK